MARGPAGVRTKPAGVSSYLSVDTAKFSEPSSKCLFQYCELPYVLNLELQ
jgi:hypothetical protein